MTGHSYFQLETLDLQKNGPLVKGEFTNKCTILWASLIAQLVKNPPATQETPVRFLGWEAPLEKGQATHSSILAERIPMGRGAWQATAHGVPQSRTRLST